VIARPPLRTRMERAYAASPPVAASRVREAAPLWAPPVQEEPPPAADVAGPGALPVADAAWRQRTPFPWPAVGAAIVVLALALAAAWTAIQPVRAVNAGDVAIERLQEGNLEAAVSVAQIAHDRNPLSPEPLWELAYIEESRGRLAAAEDAYEEAVRIQPASAEAWRRLGRFQLSSLNQPADALASFRAAYFLDPRDPASTSDFLEASRANGQAGAIPPASP
jgi:tetratricopeptide (TPR) repeat protein